MARAQLYQYFKDKGLTLRDVSERTGYHYTYVSDLVNGSTPLTDSARFRFIKAYPETSLFLLPDAETSAPNAETVGVVA